MLIDHERVPWPLRPRELSDIEDIYLFAELFLLRDYVIFKHRDVSECRNYILSSIFPSSMQHRMWQVIGIQ